jgi:hypothetical protein
MHNLRSLFLVPNSALASSFTITFTHTDTNTLTYIHTHTHTHSHSHTHTHTHTQTRLHTYTRTGGKFSLEMVPPEEHPVFSIAPTRASIESKEAATFVVSGLGHFAVRVLCSWLSVSQQLLPLPCAKQLSPNRLPHFWYLAWATLRCVRCEDG